MILVCTTSVMVRNDVPQIKVNLTTTLQATAVKMTLHETASAWYAFHRMNKQMKLRFIKSSDNSSTFLVQGDLIVTAPYWVLKTKRKRKGRILETINRNNNICIYIAKTPAYINLFTSSYS